MIVGIRFMSPQDLKAAIEGFSVGYVNDWDWWLTVPADRRPKVLGQILRRWQATRPLPMRRTRADATHQPPYLEDLCAAAQAPLASLGSLTLSRIATRSPAQHAALEELWANFSRLPTTGTATAVGITKAILLITNGRIGPAFDSQVRERLGLSRATSSAQWLANLEGIAEDIAAFEASHGALPAVVSERFSHLASGRLYDMALGPRGAI